MQKRIALGKSPGHGFELSFFEKERNFAKKETNFPFGALLSFYNLLGNNQLLNDLLAEDRIHERALE